MSRLLLVRHGDTELNSRERFWGATDVKLSAAGVKQAEQLRNHLATEKVDAVYSSDLKRALVTAETIASRHRLGVISCTELREIDFGDVEGLTYEEISQLYPELARQWSERMPKMRYPGGESRDEFDNRVAKFLGRLKEHLPGEAILIVGHSGVLRTLMCQLVGIELKFRWQIRLDLASLSILETYQQTAILSLLNSTAHLR